MSAVSISGCPHISRVPGAENFFTSKSANLVAILSKGESFRTRDSATAAWII